MTLFSKRKKKQHDTELAEMEGEVPEPTPTPKPKGRPSKFKQIADKAISSGDDFPDYDPVEEPEFDDNLEVLQDNDEDLPELEEGQEEIEEGPEEDIPLKTKTQVPRPPRRTRPQPTQEPEPRRDPMETWENAFKNLTFEQQTIIMERFEDLHNLYLFQIQKERAAQEYGS